MAKYYLGPIIVLGRVILTHVQLTAVELELPFYHLDILYWVSFQSNTFAQTFKFTTIYLDAEHQGSIWMVLFALPCLPRVTKMLIPFKQKTKTNACAWADTWGLCIS